MIQGFIELLRIDQALLEGLCNDWATVDVEGKDDSKFAKFNDILKHELFKKSHNPGLKLGTPSIVQQCGSWKRIISL